MPPIGLGVAIAATTRRRRDADEATWPAIPSRDRLDRQARTRAERDASGERTLAAAMTILLLATICIATFMAWAWMHDTGRI